MRNYWIKIAAGAFGIFAVGMLLITGFRSVKTKVTTTLNSSDPIPIPLIGLIPFRLDSARLGSIDRVEFLRADPNHLSGVRVVVQLSESTDLAHLRTCQIALESVDNINQHTTFRCQGSGHPIAGVEPFGELALAEGGETFPLLLPAKVVRDLRETRIKVDHNGIQIHGEAAGSEAAARADSLREALGADLEARSDSVARLMEQAGQLEDSATTLGAGPRRRVQRSADSVRTLMRATIDRMKADESRLSSLESVTGLTALQVDSVVRWAQRTADSARRQAVREVRRVP